MRIFIVRPFNVQDGFDFERVDAELIRPALEQLKAEYDLEIFGGTTTEIVKQGNIRTDMFRLLVTSELVIADVSTHNANVFYELGIRHGLRDRHTVLIRAKTDYKTPFDLLTDRYFVYDRNDLSKGVPGLAQTLRETLASGTQDSPVFQLLPKLRPHTRAELAPVPREFCEAVERALQSRDVGRLRLMAHEARTFEWHIEALRLVGNAQFKLKAYRGARDTFEALLSSDRDDLQANQRLGTIYQRLSKAAPTERKAELLTLSDQRIKRALENAEGADDRAEANCLLGSNAKTRWIEAVQSAAAGNVQRAALESPSLAEAVKSYLEALRQHLSDHYPAINVFALLKCQTALAEALPDVWEAQWNDEQEASNERQKRQRAAERISALLELALARDALLDKPENYDEWAISSEAEFILLTQPSRTERVKQVYRKALEKADFFTLEATRRNLEVFRSLHLFEPNTSAALDEITKLKPAVDPPPPERVVLFAGHMIDTPERTKEKRPRFPPTGKAQKIAYDLISDALCREAANPGGISLGIAGGACGSDILFHEACQAAGIRTEMMLALPEDKFIVTSVQHGNADWVERYRKLCKVLPTRVLQDSKTLPDWLAEKRDYDIWQRNNLWMMFTALTYHAQNLTFIALYNPDLDPNGPGGTKHLLKEAGQRDFKLIELDARKLLQ
jgi:tetratricopeptide repeat protein